MTVRTFPKRYYVYHNCVQVIGDEGSHCSVDIHPMTGRVDPGQSETISVKATWHQIVRNTQTVLNKR